MHTGNTEQPAAAGGTGKGKRKIAGRLGVIAGLAAVLIFFEVMATLCFDSVHFADYYNYDIKKMAEDGTDVDMLIVGASQVYHACDTEMISDLMGIGQVVDASTASQPSDGTYYLVKDLLEQFAPKYVLVSMPWDRFLRRRDVNIKKGRLLAADRMSFWNRLQMMVLNAPPGQILNLCNMYRYGGLVDSLWRLKVNLNSRLSVMRGEYVPDEAAPIYYKHNGYVVYRDGSVPGSFTAEDLAFSEDLVLQHDLDYCTKIADLCREKEVQLIWFTIPTSSEELLSITGYQESIDYMNAFCEKTGAPYLNFNLIRERDQLFPDTSFSNHIHLSKAGADLFTPILCDTIQKLEAGDAVDDLFYENAEQMLQDIHRIAGSRLTAEEQPDGSLLFTACSVQNQSIVPEYQLRMKNTQDGSDTWIDLTDWQKETEFLIAPGVIPAGAAVRLECRQAGNEETDAFSEITLG